MGLEKIAFVASRSESAQNALREVSKRYGNVDIESADAVVAIGGDGFMLQTLHRNMRFAKPTYGLMQGSVGFLMNQFEGELSLPERLARAKVTELHPLRMVAHGEAGTEMTALAINEVSLLRQTKQAAKIRVSINGIVKLEEMICDGILLSTPAGSTTSSSRTRTRSSTIFPTTSPHTRIRATRSQASAGGRDTRMAGCLSATTRDTWSI